jgi:hypothetical protein
MGVKILADSKLQQWQKVEASEFPEELEFITGSKGACPR